MNKSSLSERRNMNIQGFTSKVRKYSVNINIQVKNQMDIKVQKPLKEFRANSILPLDDETEQQSNKPMVSSFRQISLFSSTASANAKSMINQASQVYIQEKISFENSFTVQEKLGEGAHGVVKKCYHKESKKQYAVKILKMQDEHFRSIKTNFINIKQLKDQNIIKYKALYLSSKMRICHLVMEYVPFKRLHCGLDQTALRIIFYKIITAISYMHDKGICHRDLKPDNILFDQQSRSVKIIDFGVSKNMKLRGKYEEMLTNTGQLYYKAPQMFLGGSYTEKVDCWAIGITLYELITGKTPFQDNYMIETIHNIQSKPLDLEDEKFQKFHSIVKDLISKLLQRDPKKRLSCKQAVKHLWFLPHLHNVDLMKSAGNSLDFLESIQLRADLSVVMGKANTMPYHSQSSQSSKITKGEKVAMKSWLQMIREDDKGQNEQQYKYEFVQSQNEDEQHPFGSKSPLKNTLQKRLIETQEGQPSLYDN